MQSLQAVGHGADSVQYFQFRKSRGSSEKLHGAVVDHVGHEHTRVNEEIAKLGRMLQGLSGVVGQDTPAKVALIYDWENAWALNDAQGLNNVDKKYFDTVMDHYRALWSLGAQVDVISEDGDLAGYSLVVAPMLYMVREGLGQRLRAFVEAGGTLVSTFGSQGAEAMNQMIAELFRLEKLAGYPFQHIHGVGSFGWRWTVPFSSNWL